MQKVSFQTEDGVKIVGNYWEGSGGAILLLHTLYTTKEAWNDFAEDLNKENFSVLAIDMRGRGESTKQNGSILDFEQFTEEQHCACIKDVEAAIGFLKQKCAGEISVVGASIGANLALKYQSEHSEIKKSVIISAGLNYKGVETEDAAKKLSTGQKIFLLAGDKDVVAGNSVADMTNRLANTVVAQKTVMILQTPAHGMALLKAYPNLIGELVDWLKS